MQHILIALGILCWLYFLILMMKRVDFGFIWFPAGAVCLAAGAYLAYRSAHPDGFRIPGVMAAVGSAVALLVLALFVVSECHIIKAMFTKPQPDLEYVIVLGAQVKGEMPSKALRRRLEAAEDYLKENPQAKAVLSGGKGDGEDISEAECMYRYLEAAGIGKERLLMEDQSTTTQENLQFSAVVIGDDLRTEMDEQEDVRKDAREPVEQEDVCKDARESVEQEDVRKDVQESDEQEDVREDAQESDEQEDVRKDAQEPDRQEAVQADVREPGQMQAQKRSAMAHKIGILSNNFHVYRAMRLGKKMGYSDLYGIPAKSDPKLQIHYMVREFFALLKEKMMGNI